MSPASGGSEFSDEQILEELNKLVELGALEYVIPTRPLGESWVVGCEGQILKFRNSDEAAAFLMGTNVLARLVGDVFAKEGVVVPRVRGRKYENIRL